MQRGDRESQRYRWQPGGPADHKNKKSVIELSRRTEGYGSPGAKMKQKTPESLKFRFKAISTGIAG